jgi:hypothetical protein
MLEIVDATSPITNNVAGTYIIPNMPSGIKHRYNQPAILAVFCTEWKVSLVIKMVLVKHYR